MISPLEYNGLYRYWIDFEDNGEITSIRHLYGDFAVPSPKVTTIWKSVQDNASNVLNEIEGLSLILSSNIGYLANLEKIGGLLETAAAFYHATYDAPYSPLRKLADSKLPMSLVKIAISALEGNFHGLMEAKAALTLITHLLELPRQGKAFLESSGLSHLLLLITHPSASSQLILRILGTFHALLSVPQNSSYFFEKDSIQALDPKVIQTHFIFPKKNRKDDGKKQKTEEETCFRTGYQILLGLLNEKKSIKVSNNIKVLLNKCGLCFQFQKLESICKGGNWEQCASIIEAIRRNLKLQMLRSSSYRLPSVKHDLLTFLLLDSGFNLSNLQASAQFLSQPVLSNFLAEWLSYTHFLPNLLAFFLFQTSNLEDYRIAFINISDILLMLIRSQGGFGYLINNSEAVMGFIHAFQGLVIPSSNEEADFNILEEEYLLSTITTEKIVSYARQLALILSSILKFSEQINEIKNGDALSGLSGLYCYINAEDTETILSSVFYNIIKFQPDLLLMIAEQVDFSTEKDTLKSFYIMEILKIVLHEDRSGEIMLLLGPDLIEIFSNCSTGFAEMREVLEILNDWLKPISKLKNSDIENLIQDIVTISKVKKDRIEAKSAYFVIGETCYPDVDLTGFGDLSTKGSAIIQLLPCIRLLNLIISIKKWSSIQLISSNFLPILTNIISKVTHILHTLCTRPNTKEVFHILNSSQIKKDHFELILPCINIFNIIFQQFLGTELLMYNNSPMLESILHLAALCELELQGDEFLRSKISRLIKNTFVLWAQLPNFCDIYLQLIFEHLFQYSFKRSAILGIIGSIFEYYVSTKDPSFYHKCVDWLVKAPLAPLLGPELLYYYIIQAPNLEGEYKIMSAFQVPFSKVKDSSSSKYEARNAWDYKKYLGILMDRDGTVIDKCFQGMFFTNNYEVSIGYIRILRCILASNHLQASQKVLGHLKKMMEDKSNFKGRALYIMHAVSDIPCAKAICIHDDIPEVLISLLHKFEFTSIILKIFKNLFDISITSNEDEKYTYSEDMPTISQTQSFLLEIRDFLLFNIPGAEEEVMEEDDDALYGEFTKQKAQVNNISWESTYQVLTVIKELCSNVVGRSLVICGHYPYKDISGPLDFVGLTRRISLGLTQKEWQESCIALLGSFVGILKHIGTSIVPVDTLENLKSQLVSADSFRTNNLLQILNNLPTKPDLQHIELPNPRDLTLKFVSKPPDFSKIKEFGKSLKKNHFNQLVLGKRCGEKTQVKPIQFLTDLLPPPYPPQFKYKPEIKLSDWGAFLEPHQELNTEKVIEKQKAFEEKLKKMQPPRDYAPSAQTEIMMPKTPMQIIQPVMPIQSTTQFPRNLAMPTQSSLSEDEKTAFTELLALLQKKDRSHDPRLQLKIEHLLNQYPNLCSYLKS